MVNDSVSNHRRYQESRTVTVVGAAINAVLAVLKVAVGFFGHSHALITDGIHSFSDLASDAVVLYAAKHGSQDADAEHPYGHARIETAFTVALGVLLLLVSLGISLDAGRRLLDPELLLRPEPIALLVAIVSLLSKEALYRYTARAAKRLHSPLLHANAWHHRTDALSSVVVLVGVAGAMFGVNDLDALASVGVALMIAKIGWDLGWDAIRELVDTGLAPEAGGGDRRVWRAAGLGAFGRGEPDRATGEVAGRPVGGAAAGGSFAGLRGAARADRVARQSDGAVVGGAALAVAEAEGTAPVPAGGGGVDAA